LLRLCSCVPVAAKLSEMSGKMPWLQLTVVSAGSMGII